MPLSSGLHWDRPVLPHLLGILCPRHFFCVFFSDMTRRAEIAQVSWLFPLVCLPCSWHPWQLCWWAAWLVRSFIPKGISLRGFLNRHSVSTFLHQEKAKHLPSHFSSDTKSQQSEAHKTLSTCGPKTQGLCHGTPCQEIGMADLPSEPLQSHLPAHPLSQLCSMASPLKSQLSPVV